MNILIFRNCKNSKNIDVFLKSIKSQVILERINKKNSERSSQLLAKTNQFKLNSNLFSSKELIKKNSFCIFYEDKYQNYGNVGVVIYKIKKKKEIIIENWVMSCRVFSRRIEFFIFNFLLAKAKLNSCDYLSFKFEKTKKNLYLQEFLNNLNLKIKNKIQNYKINVSHFKKNKYKNYIKAKKII